jgi:hypothetical protein
VHGGLPTPLDPFEARRLVLTLLLLSACTSERVPGERPAGPPTEVRGRSSDAMRRRHVRPARSC